MTRARALVVAGHGSHLNPNSGAPTLAHADRIRNRGIFSEVRTAFWKEEPSLRDVLDTLACEEVVVVPMFVSEGYFVDEVLPRELALDDRASVRYADPVGTHPTMPDVVLDRARRVTGGGIPDDAGLAVVGHGTERNPKSAEAVRDCAGRIRERGEFEEVRAVFMDEDPRVESVPDLFDGDVVVVPMFVADGFHTREEIPELLGLADEPGDDVDVPGEVGGARIWYAGAVGTEPSFADVICERAREAAKWKETDPVPQAPIRDAAREFLDWIDAGETRDWGELQLTAEDGSYGLRHAGDTDADPTDLDVLTTPEAIRDLARYDDEGHYRPLTGAPTLPTGWRADGLAPREFVRAVDAVYPASVDGWAAERAGDLDVTHFRETAARQTGIYADVGNLDDEALTCAAAAVCGDCVRRREWEAGSDDDDALAADPGDGAIPCREACSFFVSAARTFDRLERGEDPRTTAEGSARPGDFSDPANRYRRRYLRARADAYQAEPEPRP